MPILEHYLRDLRDTQATGENVNESSFYPLMSLRLSKATQSACRIIHHQTKY